jgi:tetratricopeptide (TPR) repeat protein
VGGRSDWFRRSSWSPEDRADFESRLRRSRTAFHKSQYLRIQAFHLVNDAKPPLHEAALELLDRLLKEFPDKSQLGEAHRQRAACFLAMRRPDDALGAYRDALAAERTHPGIEGHAYLELAELVLSLQRVDLYGEMLELVTRRGRPEIFPVARYRAFGVAAFLAERLGRIADAQSFAEQALSAAAQTKSPFRFHPTLALVDETDESVQRHLWQLARSV